MCSFAQKITRNTPIFRKNEGLSVKKVFMDMES